MQTVRLNIYPGLRWAVMTLGWRWIVTAMAWWTMAQNCLATLRFSLSPQWAKERTASLLLVNTISPRMAAIAMVSLIRETRSIHRFASGRITTIMAFPREVSCTALL